MERRIAKGNVPGLRDPGEASRIVRTGFVTYRQAVNVARSGTIESLTYDAIKGIKVGGAALGVSATVAYVLAVWRGEDTNEALGAALATGLRVGGVAWCSSVLAAQLGRTQLGGLLGGNPLTAVATTMVLSSAHFARLFRGEVSGTQAFKDVATTAASVAGGVAGWQAGFRMGAHLGPVGGLVGGAVFALVAANLSGAAVRAVMDTLI